MAAQTNWHTFRRTAEAVTVLLTRRFRLASRWAAWVVIGIAALSLIGCALNIDWLVHPFGAPFTMKVNTAVCLLLAGVSLLSTPAKAKSARALGALCSVAILFIALGTLCEYWFGVNLIPNNLLPQDLPAASPGVPPGRMPPSMAVILIFAAWGLLSLRKGRQETPALLVLILGMMVLSSYIFGTRSVIESYGVGSVSGLPMLTNLTWVVALPLLALGLGLLFAEPKRSLGGLLCSPTSGGYIARRIVPLILVVPLFFGAMTIAGERAGLYSSTVRWMLFVSSSILSFCWLTCSIARRLDDMDRSRLALMEQRADIVYSLAHDLKVPVIGAQRAVELLLSSALGELGPPQRAMLNGLLDSTRDQLRMIDNLVYEYRSEQGKEPLVVGPCCLPNLIDDCLEKMGPALRARSLNIEVKHDDHKALAPVDPIAMRRVINNLLHNAMKYTPAEGELKISSGTVGGEFSFTMWNSGLALTERDRKNIFERFWQSEEGRRLSTGNGLGLYICRQIIEAHRGRISCASEPDRGTSFTVVLPAADLQESAAAEPILTG